MMKIMILGGGRKEVSAQPFAGGRNFMISVNAHAICQQEAA